MTKRVAAIDCGTNSIRLLIADVHQKTGKTDDVVREMRIVRLGEGVDATGRLAPAALERTFAACLEYQDLIERHSGGTPIPLRFVATSATRDAENRREFVRGVKGILGVEPYVASGDEEARFSFAGATTELPHDRHQAPYLVIDIGGGSTEFVLGDGERGVIAARSVDMGSVRMYERHLKGSGIATEAQVKAARADIGKLIDRAAEAVPLDEARTLVGLAGTVTTLGAVALDLAEYDSSRVHLSHLSLGRIRDLTDQLLGMTAEQRKAVPAIHPGRADVIGAGALILLAIMERVASGLTVPEVVVSERDILDGIAASIA
ncbi:Ppx/GppA family phosphatase [Catenulispora sp. NF23]|uniref:Ppx/GppA family phosphatase n=1 Tax=Catenulispora pinistramenti TaxID=2705254 RepID=A0ABS5KIA5_9ACTN|nr:Ppx/GppA phosphatase family protein [Catenulispora pinistramenti]MBS2532405.1 Ppx/GppA family phosphatase [Catenulispora pinistramenti]MBS2545600.1 Ppx/GppA family phosphatase [Catenulispora pinistramenti]